MASAHLELLRHLLRPEVFEIAVASGRLPCVRIDGGFEAIAEEPLESDAIIALLFAAGGSRYVDDLGETPTSWKFRAEGVGQLNVGAIARPDGTVQARFVLVKRDDGPPSRSGSEGEGTDGAKSSSKIRMEPAGEFASAFGEFDLAGAIGGEGDRPAAPPGGRPAVRPMVAVDASLPFPEAPPVQLTASVPDPALDVTAVRGPATFDSLEADLFGERPDAITRVNREPIASPLELASLGRELSAPPDDALPSFEVDSEATLLGFEPSHARDLVIDLQKTHGHDFDLDTDHRGFSGDGSSARFVDVTAAAMGDVALAEATDLTTDSFESGLEVAEGQAPGTVAFWKGDSERPKDELEFDFTAPAAPVAPTIDVADIPAAPPSRIDVLGLSMEEPSPDSWGASRGSVAPARATQVSVGPTAMTEPMAAPLGSVDEFLACARTAKASSVFVDERGEVAMRVGASMVTPVLSQGALVTTPWIRDVLGAASKRTDDFVFEHAEHGRFRVHATMSDRGKTLTLRPLADGPVADFDVARVVSDALKTGGLVLVAGPTGSGKTAVLEACSRKAVRRGTVLLASVERPCEIDPGDLGDRFVQREVGVTARTASRAVEAALVSGADAIVVDGVTDADTAAMVLRAAEAGRAVFVSVAATTAERALYNFLQWFVDDALAPAAKTMGRVLSAILVVAPSDVSADLAEENPSLAIVRDFERLLPLAPVLELPAPVLSA
jgi:Tfp pilus assembly pilus retraction ATPase PilT